MTAPLQVWFEFASTYSYPAVSRVENVARAAGVALEWRPFLLGPIFAAQGWNDSPFNIYPVKGRYMWRDLARICAREGFPLQHPSRFPNSSAIRMLGSMPLASAWPWPRWVEVIQSVGRRCSQAPTAVASSPM